MNIARPQLPTIAAPPFLMLIIAAAALVAFGSFLVMTQLAASPFILFAASVFLLFPFRQESVHVRRMILLLCIGFTLWLFREVGGLFAPFFVAFAFAYLLDPTVHFFHRKGVPRWVSAILFVLTFIGIVASILVFVLPVIFAQLNDIIRELSSMITRATDYLESRQFFRLLSSYGLNSPQTREIIQREIVPRLEGSLNVVLRFLLASLSNFSNVITQLVNVILTPILMFYFIKDFNKLKKFIIDSLHHKNDKLLFDLFRVNGIVKAYLVGQAIAAVLVGVASSTIFLIFGIPYAVVIGVVCGLVNPIPYIGILSSMVIGIITILVVGTGDNALFLMAVVVVTTLVLHSLDAYVLQPRIVGERVGLHALVVIAALLLFGHFFSIPGLVVAVPVTASLMMYFNDWLEAKRIIDAQVESQAEAHAETHSETHNETHSKAETKSGTQERSETRTEKHTQTDAGETTEIHVEMKIEDILQLPIEETIEAHREAVAETENPPEIQATDVLPAETPPADVKQAAAVSVKNSAIRHANEAKEAATATSLLA
jgi:predicted PurR-regulated permease PerM